MTVFDNLIRFAIALTVSCFFDSAVAAEIRNEAGTIILEGEIEPGDYNKIRDNLIASRGYNLSSDGWCSETYSDTCPHEIYLASPGGNVDEAIKIGRLVRTLGWKVIVPASGAAKEKNFGWFDLDHPEKNYVCVSACFLIFASGTYKDINLSFGAPLLGVHKPFLPSKELKSLDSSQVIAATVVSRETLGTYLTEMEVPSKYVSAMFETSKDSIRWITEDEFEADFRGFSPSFRDWVEAKCNNFTDIEKAAWESIKNKSSKDQTQYERRLNDLLQKKLLTQYDCQLNIQSEMPKGAWARWRVEAIHSIAEKCDQDGTGRLAEQLASAVSAAKPNRPSASAALELAQTLTLCFESPDPRSGSSKGAKSISQISRETAYGLREKAIRTLADRDDSRSERILANLLLLGGKTISFDQVEAVKWYGRAGSNGDLSAQEFHDVLYRKLSKDGHFLQDDEFNRAFVHWTEHDCPVLC